MSNYSTELLEKAKLIRLAAFDVDGVMTDGRLFFNELGHETKVFHVHDGLGIKLLQTHGITTAIITARTHPVLIKRAKEISIAHVFENQSNKWACLSMLIQRLGISAHEVAYMGDDLPDLSCLKQVGLSVAPANAHPWIKDQVDWHTQLSGGKGAVRELCDLLLFAQQAYPLVMHRFLSS